MIRFFLNLLMAALMPVVLCVIALLLFDDWLREVLGKLRGKNRRPG